MELINTAEISATSIKWEPIFRKPESGVELSKQVLSTYKTNLEKDGLLNCPDISEISVLGSFGRHEGNSDSDMDIWMVCPQESIDSLDKLSQISDREFNSREKVSDTLKLPELLRHKASVFTEEEAAIYRRAFSIRVGMPYVLGDFTIMTPNPKSIVFFDRNRVDVDFAVSMGEFIDHWQTAKDRNLPYLQQRKWTRRMAQEMYFINSGIRLTKNQSQEDLICEQYGGSDDNVVAATRTEIARQSQSLDLVELKKQETLHKIMWTLEKVRWELVKGHSNPGHFEKWRQGIDRSFGFYPHEIGQLVSEALIFTKDPSPTTKELGLQLIGLSRSDNETNPNEFHSTLSKWVVETAKTLMIPDDEKTEIRPTIVVPAQKDGQALIRRMGVNNARQLVETEKEALKLVAPERLIAEGENENVKWIDTVDLGGKKATAEELGVRLPEYIDRLNDFHKVDARKFGRLGSEEKFETYSDYLLSRLSKSPIPAELKGEIVKAVEANQGHLNQAKPVVCHMDSGVRNLIVDKNDNLQLIDFEHVSGCAKEWDIERVLLQLPENLREPFENLYYSTQESDSITRKITKIVMVATFASKFSQQESEQKEKYFNQVKEWLSVGDN